MMSDIDIIKMKLISKVPFMLIRYGDGEENILDNIQCQRNGFEYNSENQIDRQFRQDLIDTLTTSKRTNCYIGTYNYNLIIENSKIISPSIFINANYPKFIKEIVPIFKSKSVYLICHEDSDINNLPFKCKQIFYVTNNAWKCNHLMAEISSFLDNESNVLLLFACGPYSCVLIDKLGMGYRDNTYIDIGSTLDPYLFCKNTRQYQRRVFK